MFRAFSVLVAGALACAGLLAADDRPVAPAPHPLRPPSLPVTVERGVVYDTIDKDKLELDLA
ncbi:MAG: hypothetical protein K2V38_15285, partial [Gemmataceae bacterium]|nr:hypothetical protein [Gemmataceae bacterium]